MKIKQGQESEDCQWLVSASQRVLLLKDTAPELEIAGNSITPYNERSVHMAGSEESHLKVHLTPTKWLRE